jgi:hypothetical protein
MTTELLPARPIAIRKPRSDRSEIYANVSDILRRHHRGERFLDLLGEYGLDVQGWGRWYRAYLKHLHTTQDSVAKKIWRELGRGADLRVLLSRYGLSPEEWERISVLHTQMGKTFSRN